MVSQAKMGEDMTYWCYTILIKFSNQMNEEMKTAISKYLIKKRKVLNTTTNISEIEKKIENI